MDWFIGTCWCTSTSAPRVEKPIPINQKGINLTWKLASLTTGSARGKWSNSAAARHWIGIASLFLTIFLIFSWWLKGVLTIFLVPLLAVVISAELLSPDGKTCQQVENAL
jgi:hypothetical protein